MSMPGHVSRGRTGPTDPSDHRAMDSRTSPDAAAAVRIEHMLRTETVIWLSSVCSDGLPHLVPIWFSWDGSSVLIASKPHARKVANVRANPAVMLALGEPDDDFDVGMVEGVAELLRTPAAIALPRAHLEKYRSQMAAIGLTRTEFLATYSQVIRVRPTRYLAWHGRTAPRPIGDMVMPIDRRLAAAVRRVAGTLAQAPAG
jgi:PPOX class probable F420-dependent enzyme